MANRVCRTCGTTFPSDVPEALCPRCLMQTALYSPPPAGTGPFTPPSVAELSPHFPQLQIFGLLGQGGMGAVYKAKQLKLDRLVALKVLPNSSNSDPAFAERFRARPALWRKCSTRISSRFTTSARPAAIIICCSNMSTA